MLTMAEYLEDYAQNGTKEKGYRLIQKNLDEIEDPKFKKRVEERLDLIKQGERDYYF
jgi:2-iminoacetate synthase